jgi:hypothetical protein
MRAASARSGRFFFGRASLAADSRIMAIKSSISVSCLAAWMCCAISMSVAQTLPVQQRQSCDEPFARLALSEDRFEPGEGSGKPLFIALVPIPGAPAIASWEATIYDPGSMPFMTLKAADAGEKLVWDGHGHGGELVESSSEYPIVAKVTAVSGLQCEARAVIRTGIVLLKGMSRYRIGISSIVFKPDTADYLDVGPAQRAKNLEILRLLADKLGQFPGFHIRIEGHALPTYWQDPVKTAEEQRTSLVPLSKARAEAIRQALRRLGLPADSMEAVGLGASNPIVPYSDTANRWKNRRVEIYLESPS